MINNVHIKNEFIKADQNKFEYLKKNHVSDQLYVKSSWFKSENSDKSGLFLVQINERYWDTAWYGLKRLFTLSGIDLPLYKGILNDCLT